MSAVEHWHATAIALGQAAVLIVGPSGSGKSDLALRCIYPASGQPGENQFCLVSDDRTRLRRDGSRITVSPPGTIAGKIEVRGIGIVKMAYREAADLRLIVRLTEEQPERLPDESGFHESIMDCSIRSVKLRPYEASAPLKLALSLHQVLAADVGINEQME